MTRPNEREIEASYERAGYIVDKEDEALIRHALLDDAPPSGLHRGGYKTCDKLWHRDQPLPCQLCAMEEEEANADFYSDYLYPELGY